MIKVPPRRRRLSLFEESLEEPTIKSALRPAPPLTMPPQLRFLVTKATIELGSGLETPSVTAIQP